MISKAERAELRSIVKQQFKVLRHEVEQRQAEMIAELDEQIAERYATVDQQRQALMWKASEICEAAGRELTDLFSGTGAVKGYGGEFEVSVQQPVRLQMERVEWSQADRVQLRRAALSQLDAKVKGALLNLERREADLLRTLAMGAVESEEARSFLASIPTVGELVPAARLAEIEAAMEE